MKRLQQEKKCVRSFTSGDAQLRLFKGSSPAEKLLSTQHCNKSTAMALFVRLECSCAHRGSTRTANPPPHQGREHGANLSQTSTQIKKQGIVATTELTTEHFTLFNQRSHSTKGRSLPNCLSITLFDVVLKRAVPSHAGLVTKQVDWSRWELTVNWSLTIQWHLKTDSHHVLFCFLLL